MNKKRTRHHKRKPRQSYLTPVQQQRMNLYTDLKQLIFTKSPDLDALADKLTYIGNELPNLMQQDGFDLADIFICPLGQQNLLFAMITQSVPCRFFNLYANYLIRLVEQDYMGWSDLAAMLNQSDKNDKNFFHFLVSTDMSPDMFNEARAFFDYVLNHLDASDIPLLLDTTDKDNSTPLLSAMVAKRENGMSYALSTYRDALELKHISPKALANMLFRENHTGLNTEAYIIKKPSHWFSLDLKTFYNCLYLQDAFTDDVAQRLIKAKILEERVTASPYYDPSSPWALTTTERNTFKVGENSYFTLFPARTPSPENQRGGVSVIQIPCAN